MAIDIGGIPTQTTQFGSSYSDAPPPKAPPPGRGVTNNNPLPDRGTNALTPPPAPVTTTQPTDPQQPVSTTPTAPVNATPAPTPPKGAEPTVEPPRDPVLDAMLNFAKGGGGAKAPTTPQQGGSVYQKSGATAGNPIALIVGVLIAGVLVVLYLRSKHKHAGHVAHGEHGAAERKEGGVRE